MRTHVATDHAGRRVVALTEGAGRVSGLGMLDEPHPALDAAATGHLREAAADALSRLDLASALDALRSWGLCVEAVDLADVQVRISAVGHPFHPGHTAGIDVHGHLSDKGSHDVAKAAEHASHAASHASGAASAGTHEQAEHHAAQAAHHAAEARKHAAHAPTHKQAQEHARQAGEHADAARKHADAKAVKQTINGIALVKGKSQGWWFTSDKTIKFVPEFQGTSKKIVGYAAVRVADGKTLAEGHTLSSATRRLAKLQSSGSTTRSTPDQLRATAGPSLPAPPFPAADRAHLGGLAQAAGNAAERVALSQGDAVGGAHGGVANDRRGHALELGHKLDGAVSRPPPALAGALGHLDSVQRLVHNEHHAADSTESQEKILEKIASDGQDLADVQVRISAAGHPFHPGHQHSVGKHGEIAGKISAAAAGPSPAAPPPPGPTAGSPAPDAAPIDRDGLVERDANSEGWDGGGAGDGLDLANADADLADADVDLAAADSDDDDGDADGWEELLGEVDVEDPGEVDAEAEDRDLPLDAIQVRISAAGADFHPGHGAGVGQHGEVGGKISAAAKARHQASERKEARRKAAFLASHGGGAGEHEAHPAVKAASDATKLAAQAKATAKAHRESAADARKIAASERRRAAMHAADARTARAHHAEAKKIESAARKLATKKGATDAHRAEHARAVENLRQAEALRKRRDEAAAASAADVKAMAARVKESAARARRSAEEHRRLAADAKAEVKKQTAVVRKTKAQHAADFDERNRDRRALLEEYRQKAVEKRAELGKIDTQIAELEAKPEAAHRDKRIAGLRAARENVKFAIDYSEQTIARVEPLVGEAAKKRYVADSVAGETIKAKARSAPEHARGLHHLPQGVTIDVDQAVHPAAYGALARQIKEMVGHDKEAQRRLRLNGTTAYVYRDGTGYTDHAPFRQLKGKSSSNGVTFDQADRDGGGVANVAHNGRRYFAVPEARGYHSTVTHEFSHAQHFGEIDHGPRDATGISAVDNRIRAAYERYRSKGAKFVTEYGSGNHYEYFAESVTAWHGQYDGRHGHTDGRAWIEKNDPEMAAILRDVYGKRRRKTA